MESFRHAESEATGRFILRLAVGSLMLFHGLPKIWMGVAWLSTMLVDMGLPYYAAYAVYVSEIVAPLLILAGLLTRTAALAVALDMVVAVLLVRRPEFFTLKPAGGGWTLELEMFFFLASLALVFLGPGDYRLFFIRPRLPKPVMPQRGPAPVGK